MKVKYNLLKDAYSVKNSASCMYDSLHGYINDFNTNGDVDGWDIYSNICLYGVWDTVLFGTSLDRECYISRGNIFLPIPAEEYYVVKITMKLTIPDSIDKQFFPTKGKIMWQTYTDPSWTETKSKEFDLVINDQWYTYVLNIGESQYWQGYVNNLRIYPFIDGKPDIRFTIKTINIDSVSDFKCGNTQCSYYTSYSHPCKGTGERASITSGIAKELYTTVSGVSDELIINIDGYGEESVNLGNFENISGNDMAKILVNRISLVSVGQYAYIESNYDETQSKITIFSGTPSSNKIITVNGSAAKALGFLDHQGDDISTKKIGESPATGFDYASSRRLKGFEINKLIDSDTDRTAYYHNPGQFTVEAGRSDFIESMSSSHTSRSIDIDFYKELDGNNKLIIDGSHPVNDSGRLSIIRINGTRCKDTDNDIFNSTRFESSFSKVILLRPHKQEKLGDTEAEVIYEAIIPDPDPATVHTIQDVTYMIEVDWLVNKGDMIGFYNFNILCPFSRRQQTANAVYFEVEGLPSDKFSFGFPKAKGVIGVSYYARSNRIQENIKLDIDLGRRMNVENILVYGKEIKNEYEYNVAACLDVDWQVDLHNEIHWHPAYRCGPTNDSFHVAHRNKAYGIECLHDCIRSPDNGQVGTSYTSNPVGADRHYIGPKRVSDGDPDTYSGLVTIGDHSYFYVNGDSEWLSGGCSSPEPPDSNADYWKMEFKHPYVGYPPYDYEFDPITFTLLFPDNRKVPIHGSGMYFKDSNNFKHLSLSYYLGEFGENGNAEESHWSYVPEFNTVTIDGNLLIRGKANELRISERYEEIYFSNPWPWAKPEYKDGVCINWAIYQTVINERMNTLEHSFDPVECYGFRLHTAWHKSTKITELEVFSGLFIEPSLLDNVYIQSSVYGEDWYELPFVEDEFNNEKISAYVSGSPRYFRLDIKSQDIFKLKEINATISKEHLKSLNCLDTIEATIAPKNIITMSQPLCIENTYNIPLDLVIGIPTRLLKQNEILSWIRFDSEDTTINAEIGPGAVIRKNTDCDIVLGRGQVANNVPTYYLKNLIDNKIAYELRNNYKWSLYKTLHVNQDIEYSNVPTGKVYKLEFDKISSKYWKLGSHSVGSNTVNSLTLYNGLSLIDNFEVYIQATSDNNSGKFKTSIDQSNGNILPVSVVVDDFSNSTYLDYWGYNLGTTEGNSLIESGNCIYPFLSPWGTVYIEKAFPPGILSFDLEVNFSFDLPNTLRYSVELYDEDDRLVFVLELMGYEEDTFYLDIHCPYSVRHELYAQALPYDRLDTTPMAFINSVFTKQDTKNFIFSAVKVGNVFTSIILKNEDGSQIFYSGGEQITFPDRINKIRVVYENMTSDTYYTQSNSINTSYINLQALPVLSEREFIAFDFTNSEPMDTIEIISQEGTLDTLSVSISNLDYNDYVIWARSFSVTGDLCQENYKIYTSNNSFSPKSGHVYIKYLLSRPWGAFSSLCNLYQIGVSPWTKYDFGAGNYTLINHIQIKLYDDQYSTSDIFTTIRVYGTNTYGDLFDPISTDNTLLIEFNIIMNQTMDHDFINYTPYRFFVIYWVPVDTSAHQAIIYSADSIKLSYTYLAPSSSALTVTEANYYNYLAIDLEQVYNLDFLRNYGPSNDLLQLFNVNYIDFSASNTDNINDVMWTGSFPVLLLNFEDYTDSSVSNHMLTVTPSTTLYTSGSNVLPNGHVGFNGGSISINASSDFCFLTNNITIDFIVKRSNYGYEGVLGRVGTKNIESSFSFTFGVDDYLVATVYIGTGLFELKSLTSISINNWYHIALVRFNGVVALYIDGNLQSSKYIGLTQEINDTNSSLTLGKVGNVLFSGYLDEVRIINASAYWEHSFTPYTAAYSADIIGDKTRTRWIKIPMLCGDNIVRYLQYVGIYPDIRVAYAPEGGYNCEWESIGTRLSNYGVPISNLAIYSSVTNIYNLQYNFEEIGFTDWVNTSYDVTLASGIIQTDFSGSFPDPFWESYSDNLTSEDSTISHEVNSLKIYLDSSESGDCVFRTADITGNCICEIDFLHDFNYMDSGYIITDLTMYSSNGLSNIILRRSINSVDSTPYIQWALDGIINQSSSFSGSSIKNITKFRIIKSNTDVTVSYYNKDTNTWLYFSNCNPYDSADFILEDVYFEFSVEKTSDFPEDTVYINYIKLTVDNEINSKTAEWQIEQLSDDNYCLSYNTNDIPTDFGPILEPEGILGGKQIQYFEYNYYNQGEGGGGFSILDDVSEEVLGIATFSSYWAVKSLLGWEIIDNSPTTDMDTWYRVRATFDWTTSKAIIEWNSLSSEEYWSHSVDLIKNSNVEKFQIRNTFSKDWGQDYQNIKFDSITILPQNYWMQDWYPSNCISGDYSLDGYDNCWGFSSADLKPTIILNLGDLYLVDRFKLYHRPTDEEASWLNTDYTISISTSISGSYNTIVVETGNTLSVSEHKLTTPVECVFIKLEIDAYTKPTNPPIIRTVSQSGPDVYTTLDGGFLREFEIWTSDSNAILNSQDHPIVCMNLKRNFNITDHTIIPNGGYNIPLWSNDDEFFQFSDNITDNPQEVSYADPVGASIPFSYNDELLDVTLTGGPYLLATEVFLPVGHYKIYWSTYGAEIYEFVTMSIVGEQKVSFSSKTQATGWVAQKNKIDILISGYYSIQVEALAVDETWGIRDVSFKKIQVSSKWLSARRITAENFTYDVTDPTATPGIDIIERIKVYSSEKLRPTECYWWWTSYISTLSNDVLNTKEGESSLKILYPSSNQVEHIRFLEGDLFVHDTKYSIKDSLSIWLYISDISKLDTTEGGIAFGCFDGWTDDLDYTYQNTRKIIQPTAISWDFDNMILNTGWNRLQLRFDSYDTIYPEADNNTGILVDELNYRYFHTSSFGIVFKGTGQEFYMLIDDIKIERNYFYDEVIRGDNGLCLTWNEYAEIPLNGVDVRCGTVEMWLKLYSDTNGKDHYGKIASKTLFTLVNNLDDSISLSIRSSNWFEIGFGNVKSDYNTLYVDTKLYDLSNYSFNIDAIIHVALVWVSDGKGMDNSDTMRLYINGIMCVASATTWEVNDNKGTSLRLGGGNTYLANNDDDDGSAIFSNVKVYNFCKLEFNLSEREPIIYSNPTPNDLVQLSDDGITFYNSNSIKLPLVYKATQPGEKVTIYTRVDKTKMDLLDSVTGNITIDWKVPV